MAKKNRDGDGETDSGTFKFHPAANSVMEALVKTNPEELVGVLLTKLLYEKIPNWREMVILLRPGTDISKFYSSLQTKVPNLAWKFIPVLFKKPGFPPVRLVEGRWQSVPLKIGRMRY